MRTLSSFERHNRGRKFVVTCILVQRHEAASQEGVMNFHLCLCFVPISVFLNSDTVAKVPFSLVNATSDQTEFVVSTSPFLFQLQSSEVWCFCAWSGKCFVILQEWSRSCDRLLCFSVRGEPRMDAWLKPSCWRTCLPTLQHCRTVHFMKTAWTLDR